MEWEGLISDTAARRQGVLPTQKKQLYTECNISTSIDLCDTYVVHGPV